MKGILKVSITLEFPENYSIEEGTVVDILKPFGELADNADLSIHDLEEINKFCECKYANYVFYVTQEDLIFIN